MERDVLPEGEMPQQNEMKFNGPGSLSILDNPVESAEERRLAKEVEFLKRKLSFYEQNGTAKLYYALNRKSNEIADVFNGQSFANIDLNDKDNKSFDRIFKLIEKSEVIAKSLEALKQFAGITGDEKKDVERKPFNDRLAEDRN